LYVVTGLRFTPLVEMLQNWEMGFCVIFHFIWLLILHIPFHVLSRCFPILPPEHVSFLKHIVFPQAHGNLYISTSVKNVFRDCIKNYGT